MASDGTIAARLFVEVGARGLNETAAGLGRMGGAVDRTSSGIGGLVKAAGGIYAIKQGFDATIGSAISWESAFTGVEKTVDASDAQLANLEDTLRGMSRTMPIAAEDLAGIAEAAGQLGIRVDDIDEFTETVAMIGETTDVSADMAATALGQLSNVLGIAEDDFDNFGAALADLGNKGASTESAILGITQQAGAGAALIGIAADETLAWSSAVANLGIEAEAGGSALQRFFLGAAEHVGKAGEELDAMAQTAGMSASEFKRAFDEDASGALQRFIGGLGDLTQAEQIAMLELLGFSDVRITRTILGLSGDIDNLTDSLETGAAAWDDGTALVEEYGKRADDTASKIEMLGNRFSDLGRRLGESQGGPTNFALDMVDLGLSGLERQFDQIGLMFDDKAAALREKLDDGNFLRNNFLTEFFLGDAVDQEIIDNAKRWGVSLEEAMDAMARGFTPMTEGARQAVAAWKQADLGGAVEKDVEKIDDLFSRGGLDIAEPISEEMAKAREEAVEGMAGILDALRGGLKDDADDYEQAWEDYLSGANAIFTTDQRLKFIAGTFSGEAFNDGLHSEDPQYIADTVDFINAQLREFDLLSPGVLAAGKEVPASLQSGMEEVWPEVNAWLDERHIDTLDKLTFTEAQALGLDGIWLWYQGMLDAEDERGFVAGAIATRAINNLSTQPLKDSARNGGWAVASAWLGGLTSRFYGANPEVSAAMNAVKRQLGGSLPEEGPLAGTTAHDGGASVGDAWIDGLMRSLDAGAVNGPLASIADQLNVATAAPAFDVGSAGHGGSSGETHIHYHGPYLTVEGNLVADDEESVIATLQRMNGVSGLIDMRLHREG